MPQEPAFQDLYPDDVAWCFGCGRLNPEGHHIRSFWDGEASVCTFLPRPSHIAVPGFVYGGLIASLIDCHSTGTAAARAAREEGWSAGLPNAPRFVTGSLHVDYLKPTPLGPPLRLRGLIVESSGRKIVVESTLSAEGVVRARGRVVAVRIPEGFLRASG
jgi:acyl-coenzyme A thioesterase PaaI-like protein